LRNVETEGIQSDWTKVSSGRFRSLPHFLYPN